jgi:hypothetical protein
MAAKTAMQMPNLQMPTGYEEEQRKIALKRKLAQMMFEQGLGNGPRARSPWDALASIAQVWAGKSSEKDAGKIEARMNERLKGDFTQQRTQLQADINAGMSPQQILQKYGANTLLQGELEPFRDAFGTALKEREKLDRFGNTIGRQGDFVGKPIPGKPTDKVIDVNGQWQVNPVAMTADLFSNPLPPGAEVSGGMQSMANPYAGPTSQPPSGAPAPMPAVGNAPSAAGMDLSRLSPEERQILERELTRRAGVEGSDPSIPSGNPLDPGLASKPPMGMPGISAPKVIGGQQYWNINGKWYDNPEGR